MLNVRATKIELNKERHRHNFNTVWENREKGKLFFFAFIITNFINAIWVRKINVHTKIHDELFLNIGKCKLDIFTPKYMTNCI